MKFIEFSLEKEKVFVNIEKYDPRSSEERSRIKTLIYLPENCLMVQESVEEILKLIEEASNM